MKISSLQVVTAERPFECSSEVIFLTIKLYVLDIWFVKRILKAIPNILSTKNWAEPSPDVESIFFSNKEKRNLLHHLPI